MEGSQGPESVQALYLIVEFQLVIFPELSLLHVTHLGSLVKMQNLTPGICGRT